MNLSLSQIWDKKYPKFGETVGDGLSRSTIHGKIISFFKFFRGLGKAATHGEDISFGKLYKGLQKVIEDMDFIKNEVMGIKEKTGIKDQPHKNLMPAGSLRSPFMGQNTMVGFDNILNEIMEQLNGGQLDRQIIPIVGMGGIGKTTLARNIYANPVIVERFDILAWITISHDYSIQEIFMEVLLCPKINGSRESLSQMSEDKIGQKIYQSLSGTRYLTVMDDVWSIDVWDKVKCFFPDNKAGSGIIITTRLSNEAFQLSGSHGHQMKFLDESNSWNLLCKNVFGKVDCPLELEEIGKKIAKNCKGLPLSIAVIGGLLAKSEQTQKYWEYIAENLNSIVHLEDSEHVFSIWKFFLKTVWFVSRVSSSYWLLKDF